VEKRPLGRPAWIEDDNIKMDFQGVGCNSVDWVHQGRDRNKLRALVIMAMLLLVARSGILKAWLMKIQSSGTLRHFECLIFADVLKYRDSIVSCNLQG
jgi:hypothetical protein